MNPCTVGIGKRVDLIKLQKYAFSYSVSKHLLPSRHTELPYTVVLTILPLQCLEAVVLDDRKAGKKIFFNIPKGSPFGDLAYPEIIPEK